MECYTEIHPLIDDKYSSFEPGFFICHIGNGNFDIYDKPSGQWYKGKLKFPYYFFRRYREYPELKYINIKERYESYEYLTFCKYCEKKFILPSRIDKCNECYREINNKNFKIQNIFPKRFYIS